MKRIIFCNNGKCYISFLLVFALVCGFYTMPQTVFAGNGTRNELLALAASQVGYHEKASNSNLDDFTANSGSANYTKYARDLGVGNGQAWCAYFIWWCMQSAGVNSNNYPRVGYATRDWFNSRGLWHARGTYTPQPGDYVAFGSAPNHCGIVESVSNGKITTIEGNSSDGVRRNSYSMSNSYILGYGTINYNSGTNPNGWVDFCESKQAGTIWVRGWAFDADASQTSIQVHVYIGGEAGTNGAEGHVVMANTSRPDVNSAYGIGGNHGFDTTITTSKTGSQEVYIYAINVGGGVNVILGHYTVNINKLSQLNSKKDIGTGFYATIKNKAGGTVLTNTSVVSSASTNARTVTSNSETGEDNQLWYFEKQGDGSYKITSKLDKRVLDYREAKDVSMNTVWAYDNNGTDGQRWYLYETSDNYCYIQGKKCENTLLDIYGGSTAQGGTVHLYELNMTNAQQFLIQKYYQVTFKDGSSVLKTQMVKSGSNASVPNAAKDGYILSWDKGYSRVTNNITVNAVWTKVQQENTPVQDDKKSEENTAPEVDATANAQQNVAPNGTISAPQNTIPQGNLLPQGNTITGNNSGNEIENEDEIWEDFDEDEPEIEKASIKSLKNKKKKSLQLYINKLKNVDGYEVSIGACNQKSLKKLKKKLKHADGDTISMSGMKKRYVKKTGVKISNLKKNTTYYVLVRGYKKVDGEKIYGEYSNLKWIKIKK